MTRLRSSKIDGPQNTSSIDPGHKVRLVTSNQAKREASIRGELNSVKPKVTLPKFSWDK